MAISNRRSRRRRSGRHPLAALHGGGCRAWSRVVLALQCCALPATLVACRTEAARLVRRPPELLRFSLVRRPPPVVPVDVQPAAPGADAVWVPGSWTWRADGWIWHAGAWVIPPPGASWSPWAWSYQADGRVRFWEARWFGPDGQPISGPTPLLAPAGPRRVR
jgi:hypothetical protein